MSLLDIQRRLAARGLYSGGIDGNYGPLTEAAIGKLLDGVYVAPSRPVDAAPSWFKWALHEVGIREVPENRGPDVRRYVQLSHCGAEGEPWCAIFANAALESVGIPGTRSPSSQSFRNHPEFVKLSGPALGAVAVFWRQSPSSGLGHVGFYRGENLGRVYVLGGNEGDAVAIEPFPKQSATFGLVAYYWPRSVPLPVIGPVPIPGGTPTQSKVT